MKTILDLLIITGIVVFIVDISGAVESLKTGIKRIFTKGKMSSSDFSLKPLDCSLCMTFWIGLIYLLIMDKFTLPYIGYVCALSAMVEVFNNVFHLVKDTCTTVINLMFRIIDWLNKTK